MAQRFADSRVLDPSRPVLGLDIGGTKLAAGVVTSAGSVLSFGTVPTHGECGPGSVLSRLFDLGRKTTADAGLRSTDLAATGIGCGGPLDTEQGMLLAPPHLPGWRHIAITGVAEHELGIPAILDNDATAAALAEHRFGAGRGTRNMAYLTVSTGIGGGLVLEGKPYRGTTGNGGELGHITVDRFGRDCRGCGRRGCLEAYASGTSIAERAREVLGDRESLLHDADPLTAERVSAAAMRNDPLAVEVWRETVEALVCGLASIVNLYEPELVVVGGGVARSGDQLLRPVRAGLRAAVMGPVADLVDVRRAALRGQVGVVGAAAVAFDRISAAEKRSDAV